MHVLTSSKAKMRSKALSKTCSSVRLVITPATLGITYNTKNIKISILSAKISVKLIILPLDSSLSVSKSSTMLLARFVINSKYRLSMGW